MGLVVFVVIPVEAEEIDAVDGGETEMPVEGAEEV